MKVNGVTKIWIDYHTTHSKKNTVRSYQFTKNRFCKCFGESDIVDLKAEAILKFLNDLTLSNKPYTNKACDKPDDPIFPLSYETARRMVMKSGKMVGIQLRLHDLRRHSATYASRSGVPIEIVSKVILRHGNLSTTQRYLGTISDDEAKR